ncbi:MAG: hypothetical protein ACR2FG_08790 [Marmoricola sp.]
MKAPTPLRSAMRPVVLAVAVALVLGGCGSTAKKAAKATPTDSLPTQSVTPPSGVTLTAPGTELGFGKSATVGFAPNAERSTALELTVTKVRQGQIKDLAAYDLDPAAKRSRPYYVSVKVKNVGTGQVGRSRIPLWGLGSDKTLIGASGFTNAFTKCPSGPLPAHFAGGKSTRTCLMFLVPHGDSLAGVSYRPVMTDAPIVWKGKIVPAAPKHKHHKQSKKQAQKHKKKATS